MAPESYYRAKEGVSHLAHGRNPRTGRSGRYTAIVGAEYVSCMVMILLSFGLVGKRSQTPDVLAAPVVAMVRLTAVTLLFFALSILSTGQKSGRVAAAFGGLVACGVALNATNEWRALASVFQGHKAPAQTSGS